MEEFKKPKEYRPDLVNTAIPLTQRQQILKDLGLDDDGCEYTGDTESSGEEGSDSVASNEVPVESDLSAQREEVDYKAMNEMYARKMQERREELRSLLQHQIEISQKQEIQLKLMKRLHEEAIVEKNITIRNLSDLITEKDERIAELTGKPYNPELAGCRSIDKVINQLKVANREKGRVKLTLELTKVDLRNREQTIEELQRKLTLLEQRSIASQEIQSKYMEVEIVRNLTEENSASRHKIGSLRKDLLSVKEEKNLLDHQMLQTVTELEESKDLNEKLKKDLKLTRQDHSNLEEEVRLLREMLTTMERDKQIHLEEMKMFKEELRKVKHQLTVANDKLEAERRSFDSERTTFQSQLRSLQAKFHSFQDSTKRSRSKAVQISCVGPKLLGFHSNLHSIKSHIEDLKEDVTILCAFLPQQLKHIMKKISAGFNKASHEREQLLQKYKVELLQRRRLNNELADLRGRIRVFARIRPVIPEDSDSEIVTHVDNVNDSLIHLFWKKVPKVFTLDRIFGESALQTKVFQEVKDIVLSVVDGYNVCILAYGQTGSGKTYTMEGTPVAPGINQLVVRDLFKKIEERKKEWSYAVYISLVEVYNEKVFDLLGDSANLKVKQDGMGGNYVEGVKWIQVEGVEQTTKVFKSGQESRKTAATTMNIQSSRSHSILCFHVEGINHFANLRTIGKLNLVDLAGSERVSKSGATGQRLKEAQFINKSLSALGDVMHALRTGQAHVPFRNSKLTYLIKDCLSGDSKVCMFVQLSPTQKNVGESLCSLLFAERAMQVELGRAMACKTKLIEGQFEGQV